MMRCITLLFISLLACLDKEDDSVEPELQFGIMDFKLESAEGNNIVADGARIFFSEGSEFSFSAGCNN